MKAAAMGRVGHSSGRGPLPEQGRGKKFLFLGTFATLQQKKKTIIYVMSVCPSHGKNSAFIFFLESEREHHEVL